MSGGKPETVKAAINEVGPGIASTAALWWIHSRTSLYPGSETSGVPASETKAIFLPKAKSPTTEATFNGSLKSLSEIILLLNL